MVVCIGYMFTFKAPLCKKEERGFLRYSGEWGAFCNISRVLGPTWEPWALFPQSSYGCLTQQRLSLRAHSRSALPSFFRGGGRFTSSDCNEPCCRTGRGRLPRLSSTRPSADTRFPGLCLANILMGRITRSL